jgi:predicted negative regulator of RcsB-dependent stress response
MSSINNLKEEGSEFVNKVKVWWRTTGLTNAAYLIIGVAAKIILGSNLLLGAALGIFTYINWNIISKLRKKL